MTTRGPTSRPAPTACRVVAINILRWLTVVTVLAIAAQFALAGYGAFTTLSARHAAMGAYGPHEVLGEVIGGLELLVLAVAVAARRWNAVIFAVIAFLLAMPVQPLLAGAGHQAAWAGALHALVGVVLFALTAWLARDAVRAEGAPRRAPGDTSAG